MGKILLNLTLGEPLSLVKKLPYFDDPIELDVLLASALHIGVHDSINFLLFNVFMIYSIGSKFLSTSEVSRRGGKYG
jgi:hypothetical protein